MNGRTDRRPVSEGLDVRSSPAGAGQRPEASATADETVVALEGELDLPGAERLRALLDDAVSPRRRLVLDLSSVTHVCAVALGVLVAGHRRLRDAGGSLVVRSPSAAVVRELRISGLHRVIAVDPPDPGSGPA